MKYIIPAFLILVSMACNSTSKMNAAPLKGKLVVSELCGHYIVELISGKIEPDKLAKDWHDDKRNATYKQSFAIANTCNFERFSLKEGDEFTFTLDSDAAKETCAVCMAYYPKPSQSLFIKDIQKITP
jgi:hypothetical protein